MNVTMEKTVRELALERPGAARVFEKLGHRLLLRRQADTRTSLPRGQCAGRPRCWTRSKWPGIRDRMPAKGRNWQTAPLADLISHIKNTHHKYTREEIARLGPLFDKVCSVHGKNHPELLQLRETFQGLAQELTTHLMKEEMVLFPYIERMEESVLQKEPILPPPFGTVQNPVAMMEHEHDSAGNALRALRATSNGYTAPPDGCVSYQTLYKTLAELEADLHQHIHLENNILFPRAIALERAN